MFRWSDNFANNLGIRHKFEKYLKESCMCSDEQFPFKYFPKYLFIREISPKMSGLFFGGLQEWVNKAGHFWCPRYSGSGHINLL